ncbi:CLUMA_CG009166, isoform A [Clunio marinus]|uniref:CLUMA_CG009166, isoform A n=1 Tax=Clunio marinus TaxID=568069 RepID=A0A1J1I5Y7_9DIPT|nr:CLUMA_CG009166, isoform A [Clunio marinus]
MNKRKAECGKQKRYLDLSQPMPPNLHERVAKIVSLPFGKDEPFEEQRETGSDLTEENFIKTVEQRKNDKPIEVIIEPRAPEIKLLNNNNWIAQYTTKPKKERIVWKTKLFKDIKGIHEDYLIEKTEELFKFTDKRLEINKERVNEFFSIEVDGDASRALHIEPKEMSVVPHEVAIMMNLPSHSIQNKSIKILQYDKKLRHSKKPKTVAFGSLLPSALRQEKFNEDFFDEVFAVNCPSELRSMEVVFKSILHLDSTKVLINHLKANPEIPRPKYLVDNKFFDTTEKNLQKKKL